MTKKLIILRHGGGELANQLWNYLSIYAYGLEIGLEVKNPSFFEYHSYFKFIEDESILTKIFSFWFRNVIARRSSRRNKFWRTNYLLYAKIVENLRKKSTVSSINSTNKVFYLPPTAEFSVPETRSVYFLGWLFRNPRGINKYRSRLTEAFRPIDSISIRCEKILSEIRQNNKKVVGIHIRQGDYKHFKNGIYFIDQKRVREIINEYINRFKIEIQNTAFLITSDGPVDVPLFDGLNVFISKENSVTDLFLLSQTDAIIGSDSSFGAFASWYGNIPHIVMKNETMDWDYYLSKKEYSENKYAKMVQY